MKTLYFECNMGAAGDMLLGALYELCDRKEDFLRDMNAAFASYGAKLTVEPSVKCGIRGTHMRVLVHGREEAAGGPGVREHGSTEPADAHADGNDHVHTHEETHTHATYRSVLETLGDLALPDEVKKMPVPFTSKSEMRRQRYTDRPSSRFIFTRSAPLTRL